MIAGIIGACVGSDRRTATGIGVGLAESVDAAIAGGRGFRVTFVFFVVAASFQAMVSVCLSLRNVCRSGFRRLKVRKTIQKMAIDGWCGVNSA